MSDGAPITPGSGLGVATDEITFALTGTVAKNGTTAVVGTGTAFTTEISVGQVIRIPGTATEDRIVGAITDDTHLTVGVAFTNTASGQAGSRVSHVQFMKQMDATDGSANRMLVNSSGQITAIVVGQASSSATISNVAASATNVTLKASNASRKALYIFNGGTANLFVKLGATATATTSFTYMIPPNGFWELPDDPIYTGIVDGIWSATGGNGAQVTEF